MLLLLLLAASTVTSMRVHRTWTTQPWCNSVVSPTWPFAYQKDAAQTVEYAGRVNSNAQDMRHACTTFGVQSKCHLCQNNAYQIQGVDWNALPKNIPTVSDVPFVVSTAPTHRYDYGNAAVTHLCVLLSGDGCISPFATSYATCTTRCWGYQHPGTLTRQPDIDTVSDFWDYPNNIPTAQGQVSTVAGTGTAGFLDGPVGRAQFSSPRGLVVDSALNVYVADTNNHRIRMINPVTKLVSTLAGTGVQGYQDGPMASATFSYPAGIAVFENTGVIKLYVADTGNHRIREINLQTQVVTCVAGRCGVGTETATLAQVAAPPQPGLADGSANNSTLNTPMGVAVDSQGIVYVADTGNNVIRRIGPGWFTTTLAGTVVPQPNPILGCAPPCVMGVAGFQDGSLTSAQFNHPTDVTLGPANTLYVADDHRVRRVTIGSGVVVQGVTSSQRVATVAGAGPYVSGETDGLAAEASFHVTGVAMSADGRVFTTSAISSHVRTLSPASLSVVQITCTTTLVQVVSPSGCASYEPVVGALHQKISPAMSNIYYNFVNRTSSTFELGKNVWGRTVQMCHGTPPINALYRGPESVTMYDANGAPVTALWEDVDVGTTITVQCPATCNAAASSQVFGTTKYTDLSQICYAAIHAGFMTTSTGALLTLTLESNTLYQTLAYQRGTTAHGVTSMAMPSAQAAARLFSLAATPLAQVVVQTVAGAPVSLLETPRGYRDGAPPLFAKFQGPTGIDVYGNPSATNLVYVADAANHVIRGLTATCSKVCENGGQCVGTETCACAAGWDGDDCTIPLCATTACSARQICVGPNTCACVPGYTGAQCDVVQCVQTCVHGVCGAPDTCTCDVGWFDANCTTPVCSQTCGNGGNCTGPSTCTCSAQWQGIDCRTPVCAQTCGNGGVCTAPNTCLCPAGWSGHDCSIPVCSQGTFLAHPSGHAYGLFRPFSWDMYVPCQYAAWCAATAGLDCALRPTTLVQACSLLELRATALSPFTYTLEHNGATGFMRYSPATPYGQDRVNLSYAGAPVLVPGPDTTPPYTATPDRIVAQAELRRVTQGVYVCDNGGNCTAPDVCVCAPGWSGFDCRTPICTQGYYTPTQPTFVAADPHASADVNFPSSSGNPVYAQTTETLAWDHYTTVTQAAGNVRFLSQGSLPQGGYACSMRSLTQFEKPATRASPAYYWNHPNYYSRYMNNSMYWPPLYAKSPAVWDDTQDGYTRHGIWSYISPTQWQKGTCLLEFERTCPGRTTTTVVTEPDSTYRQVLLFTAANATPAVQLFVGCVDYVLRGCYNNGTCVAPDTCACAPGWVGADCSIPVCAPACVHGTCTLPNTCTCDLGWTGAICTVAICAQECRNGGQCVAPDTCLCVTWPSLWRDGQRNGGQPTFQLPDGSPQLTGCVVIVVVIVIVTVFVTLSRWTGYDCNTPICTQAQRFVLNVVRTSPAFVAMRGTVGKTPCVHLRCPQYDIEVTSNDGTSFQSGCAPGIPFPNPIFSGSVALKEAQWDAYLDVRNNGRQSSTALCGVLAWRQGEFTNRTVRLNHATGGAGEGVYECYHQGSCVQPDVCSCGDGYAGFDCQTPLCRFTTPAGAVTGCQHNGVCVDKDTCACIQTDSVLYQKYNTSPRGRTGWAGSSCSMAICVQGFYDAQCFGQAPVGHEGCYRCANGGQCVAPDLCQCAPGWTGYDCTEPVCHVAVTPELRTQLFTVDETKVLAFENDPCGTNGGRWGKEMINGALVGQGNCTMPQLCTCLCRARYDYDVCKKTGQFCLKPWSDMFSRVIPVGYLYGTKRCTSGFQGLEDARGRFQSCHLQIYEPTTWERYTSSFVALITIFSILFVVAFYCIRKRSMAHMRRLKAERRRSRRNSEDQPLKPEFAFGHAQ
ncbi:Aste57867_20642 [Aphanomyces stellatus]|uniref:Aste57867_20642 protein n=1 Tax=Aphanomyces stellatus TaxID=120398 RepID=A0A485LG13_9STRA|nr:hypothetical protein As57867_020574 [Aphanomyces stellatus]VFT97322.1 Aste57867_20642 [Aphanomyces stellatus]